MPTPHRHIALGRIQLYQVAVAGLMALTLNLIQSAAAQAPPADKDNAAHWYQQAIDLYEALKGDYTDQQWNAIWEYQGLGEPPPEVSQIVREMDDVIDLMQRGAAQDHADFGLEYSKGIEMLLPHLSQVRQIGKVMEADARRRINIGDSVGGANRLADMYRLAEHMGDDKTLISSLVGNALFRYADETVQQGFDHGKFNPVDASVMLKAMRRMDASDPFNVRGGIAMEQEILVDWTSQYFNERGGDAEQFIQELGMGVPGQMSEDQAALAQSIRDTGVDRQIELMDEGLSKVIEAFMVDDPEQGRAMLAEIDQEMEDGKYGVLATILMPAYLRVYDNMVQSRAAVAERTAMLEKLVTGELEPAQASNAALDYLQAIEDLNRMLTEPQLEVIATYAADPMQPPDPQLGPALEQVMPVVDLLRTASQKQRCSFEFIWEHEILKLAHEYQAGLQQLFDLLIADAGQALQKGAVAVSADRIAIVFRMAGQLGEDTPMLTPLISHRAVGQLLPLIATAQQDRAFTVEQQALMREALETVGRSDPFGYIQSLVQTRQELTGSLAWSLRTDVSGRSIRPNTRSFNANEVMFFLADFDYLRSLNRQAVMAYVKEMEAAAETGEREAPATLPEFPAGEPAPLPDAVIALSPTFVDLEAIDMARLLIPTVLGKLLTEPSDEFQLPPLPIVADVVGKQRQARSDVRQLHMLLEFNEPGRDDVSPDDATDADDDEQRPRVDEEHRPGVPQDDAHDS